MEASPTISTEMRARYLERRKSDFAMLVKALADQDFETFARVGHQLKGNASTFGYADLEEIAVGLEAAGMAADAVISREALSKLRTWIQNQE